MTSIVISKSEATDVVRLRAEETRRSVVDIVDRFGNVDRYGLIELESLIYRAEHVAWDTRLPSFQLVLVMSTQNGLYFLVDCLYASGQYPQRNPTLANVYVSDMPLRNRNLNTKGRVPMNDGTKLLVDPVAATLEVLRIENEVTLYTTTHVWQYIKHYDNLSDLRLIIKDIVGGWLTRPRDESSRTVREFVDSCISHVEYVDGECEHWRPDCFGEGDTYPGDAAYYGRAWKKHITKLKEHEGL